MAAGALCPIGGSITLSNCFKIWGSSIAIKLVVCLLHPDGASIHENYVYYELVLEKHSFLFS